MKKIEPITKLWLCLGAMGMVIAFGSLGYVIIEQWPFLDSIYFTIITLTTIGYGEIRHLSDAGRLFTIFLIGGGMSVVIYAARNATQLIVEGQVRRFIGRRQMERSLKRMRNHFIICGFGRTGRKICEQFLTEKIDYVVIERHHDIAMELETCGVPFVQGDATNDDILMAAGVERAKGLITALDSPADNVFITLTARGINSDIHIVARSDSPDTEQKLFRAGADKVISPHSIGGRQMALAALRPSVVQFLEFETLNKNYGIQIEEIRLQDESELCGKSLKDAKLSQHFGLIVIGVLKKNDEAVFNPGPTTVLNAGDDLILFGSGDQLQRLEAVASGKKKL